MENILSVEEPHVRCLILPEGMRPKIIGTADIFNIEFKSLQIPIEEETNGRSLLYRHVPTSLSVTANMPGCERVKHKQSDGDALGLVDKLVAIWCRRPTPSTKWCEINPPTFSPSGNGD